VKRGHVTHDQINSVLLSEEITSEQIEDVLAMFSEMGVNVVETGEASQAGEEQREEAHEEAESESGSSKRSRPSPTPRSRPSAPTIPCACIAT
jgi:RNA polymerase primary sigma factor